MLPVIVAAVGGVVALALVVISVVSLWIANWMTKVQRLPLYDHPSNHGIEYEDVSFPSRHDKIPLSGWYLPSLDDTRCIILIHGDAHHRNSPGIRALELGRDLAAQGFSVLLFDFRGRGESGGKRGSAGYREQWDVFGAIDYVRSRSIPTERVGLHGFSIGAGVAILVADQEKAIPAVVADSAFLDAMDDLKGFPIRGIPLPNWFAFPIVWAGRLIYGMDISKVRPVKIVGKIAPRPIFFIHGESDRIINSRETEELFKASANEQNQIWIVPGAGHINSYVRNRKAYAAKVGDFFNKHIPDSSEN